MIIYNGRLEYRKDGWERCAHEDITCRGVTLFVFRKGECKVLVSQEGGKWHLSISTKTRNPDWEEIKGARYSLIPHEVTMAQILPPPSEWVNMHPFCFHLHEIRGE